MDDKLKVINLQERNLQKYDQRRSHEYSSDRIYQHRYHLSVQAQISTEITVKIEVKPKEKSSFSHILKWKRV